MTVTSGLRCLDLFSPVGPLGCLSRMLLAWSGWSSTTSLLTWKVRVTKRRRLLYLLAVSVPHTGDTAHGLWPTPTSTRLSEQALPVWIARRDRAKREKGQNNGLPLNVAVKMWPTPTEDDGSNVTRASGVYQSLTRSVGASQEATLNPAWDELLMGYPIGWTDVGPRRALRAVTRRSTTGSRRVWRKTHRIAAEGYPPSVTP